MSQQAGWYDDPENADNLRYWDGVQWTRHTSPKQKPNLEQAGRAIRAEDGWGAAPGQQGGQHGQQTHGGHQAQGQPGQGWQGQGQQGYGQTNPYAGGAQPPFHGQGQWQPMPGGQYLQSSRATTPDGQRLAGWWHRVGARLIDGIFTLIVGALVANVVVPGVWADYLDWALSITDPAVGGAATFDPPAELMGRLTTWSLVVGVVGLVYEIVLVTLLGGTLGKLATGLRIRLREEPGNVSWGTSILRALVYQLCGLFAPAYLLNVLWPLWDDKRQALHDKAARTNVVRKR